MGRPGPNRRRAISASVAAFVWMPAKTNRNLEFRPTTAPAPGPRNPGAMRVRIILMFEAPCHSRSSVAALIDKSLVCARAGTGTRPRESAAAWFPREADSAPSRGRPLRLRWLTAGRATGAVTTTEQMAPTRAPPSCSSRRGAGPCRPRSNVAIESAGRRDARTRRGLRGSPPTWRSRR